MYVSTSLATLNDQSNVWIGYKKNLSGLLRRVKMALDEAIQFLSPHFCEELYFIILGKICQGLFE